MSLGDRAVPHLKNSPCSAQRTSSVAPCDGLASLLPSYMWLVLPGLAFATAHREHILDHAVARLRPCLHHPCSSAFLGFIRLRCRIMGITILVFSHFLFYNVSPMISFVCVVYVLVHVHVAAHVCVRVGGRCHMFPLSLSTLTLETGPH